MQLICSAIWKRQKHYKKGEINVKPLQERQLFHMKRDSLEKKINHYYSETQDADQVIEYGMAVLAKNSIVIEDYSFLCKDLIREIFLTCEPTEKMRDFCLYFYDYFEFSEWEKVRNRLFRNQAEFFERTHAIRRDMKYIRAVSAPTLEAIIPMIEHFAKNDSEEVKADYLANQDLFTFTLKTVFEDENGKRTRLNLKNADLGRTHEALAVSLGILAQLTIFQKDGVQRYANIMWEKCKRTSTLLDTWHSAKEDKKVKASK